MSWDDIPEINFMPEENKAKIKQIFNTIENFDFFPPERTAEMDEAMLWNI